MDIALLSAEKDPMGAAIKEFYETKKAGKLRVFSSMFEEDEIPVAHLFRSFQEMSSPEQTALNMSQRNILDVGAGSGCHSLVLQEMGKSVEAWEISPLSVEVMQKRGVSEVKQANFFDQHFTGTYDTILLLMNGSGIIGKIEYLPQFFNRLKQLLSPSGFVLMDSSDLKYLFEEEDGSYLVDLNAAYYGEVDFQMQYKQIKGDSFDWLYIDFRTLQYYADQFGFKAEIVQEGEHYDYLAKISYNR